MGVDEDRFQSQRRGRACPEPVEGPVLSLSKGLS